MLRNGHRLWRMLHGGWSTRCRFFSSVKSEQSLNYQPNQADEGAVRREADDATRSKVPTPEQTFTPRAVVKRPKPLTREPFVKNLFLGNFDTVSCIFMYMNFCFCHFVSQWCFQYPVIFKRENCEYFYDFTHARNLPPPTHLLYFKYFYIHIYIYIYIYICCDWCLVNGWRAGIFCFHFSLVFKMIM